MANEERKKEKGRWVCRTKIEKREGDINACVTEEERRKFLQDVKPYEVVEKEGNLLLNAGITEIFALLRGSQPPGPAWAAGAVFAVGAVVTPGGASPLVFECTTAGTSAATEPAWPGVIGATVSDGTALVWTCREDPRLFNNTATQIGVGDSTAVEVATQTDLQASTNKAYKGQDAGFPTTIPQGLKYRATFGDMEANFVWAEWVLKSVSPYAPRNLCLNRKVEPNGTKASGSWTFEVTVSLT